jgi:hypothetical protein
LIFKSEQARTMNLDLQYRLRKTRELAMTLHLLDETLRVALAHLNTARQAIDLYYPEPNAPLPAAFKGTSSVCWRFGECLRMLRRAVMELREKCYDTATDFRQRLQPVVVGEWARSFPHIGHLSPATDESCCDADDAGFETTATPMEATTRGVKARREGEFDFLIEQEQVQERV